MSVLPLALILAGAWALFIWVDLSWHVGAVAQRYISVEPFLTLSTAAARYLEPTQHRIVDQQRHDVAKAIYEILPPHHASGARLVINRLGSR